MTSTKEDRSTCRSSCTSTGSSEPTSSEVTFTAFRLLNVAARAVRGCDSALGEPARFLSFSLTCVSGCPEA